MLFKSTIFRTSTQGNISGLSRRTESETDMLQIHVYFVDTDQEKRLVACGECFFFILEYLLGMNINIYIELTNYPEVS